MSGQPGQTKSPSSLECRYFRFGLIVTGRTEEQHLHKMFRLLMSSGTCSFQVVRRVEQRGPITSPRRKLRMVANGKIVPDRDASEIGLPARRHLDADECNFVILVDDLEWNRRKIAAQVFCRYRRAFDTILTPNQRHRASVHFLVHMLEAYYFADARAVNEALRVDPPLRDHRGDVETIRNPKTKLRELYSGFDEIQDGGRILDVIDLERILSRPRTCASLRTLVAWCVRALERYSARGAPALSDKFRLGKGILSDITKKQLDTLSRASSAVRH